MLSSALIVKLNACTTRNKSFRDVSNRIGQRIEPSGTLNSNSSHELYAWLILVICFRSTR